MARRLKPSENEAVQARREALRRREMRLKEQARQAKRIRPLVTPEGAALNLRIASASERAGAFLLDFSLQIMAMIIFSWLLAVAFSEMGFRGWQVAGSIAAVVVFLLRVFYFVFFEIGRKAATPGKRALGLRVAARDGGRLTANAVLARNFMRELEVFLPLTLLVMGAEDDISNWIRLLALVWAGIFVFFPLFNSEKLRVGDLIAGTMVIHAPRVKRFDLATKSAMRFFRRSLQFLIEFDDPPVDRRKLRHLLREILVHDVRISRSNRPGLGHERRD